MDGRTVTLRRMRRGLIIGLHNNFALVYMTVLHDHYAVILTK